MEEARGNEMQNDDLDFEFESCADEFLLTADVCKGHLI